MNARKQVILEKPKTYYKHTIIVDTWIGFVDYIHNGLTRYQEIFIKNINQQQSIKQEKYNFNFIPYNNINPNKKICEMIANRHPELIVKI